GDLRGVGPRIDMVCTQFAFAMTDALVDQLVAIFCGGLVTHSRCDSELQGDFSPVLRACRVFQCTADLRTLPISKILDHPDVALEGLPQDRQALAVRRGYTPGFEPALLFPKNLRVALDVNVKQLGALRRLARSKETL